MQGNVVEEPLQDALISSDKAYVYPVLEGFISTLLANRAISFKAHEILAGEKSTSLSALAIKEAAIRLKGKGIFILGDMTNIPLKENCVDGIISMHTVYHVPRPEQTKAVAEAYRGLSHQGQGRDYVLLEESRAYESCF